MKKKIGVIFILCIGLLKMTMAQSLSGVYTIGGTSPDYINFSAAITALQSKGISSPVVFNIRPGTYTGMLTLPAVTGSSVINTITFQPENVNAASVIIYYYFVVPGNLITFNSSAYYKMKNMTFRCQKSSPSDVVTIISGVGTCSDIELSNNTFEHTSSSDRNYGILSSDLFNNFNVLNNNFNSCYEGLSIGGGTNNTIAGNNFISCDFVDIHSVNNLNFHDNRTYYNSKISFLACSGAVTLRGNDAKEININSLQTSSWLIANNMMYTLTMELTQNGQLVYNTIRDKTTISDAKGLTSKNNIFNSHVQFSYVTGLVSDYNIYNSLIQWNTTNYTLPNFQAVTSGDGHSQFITPDFVSGGNGNLHIANGTSMSNMGVPVSSVTNDFDGEPRSLTKPDIGADEFGLQHYDVRPYMITDPVGNACPGVASVKVRFINSGDSAITSLVAGCAINHVIQAPVNWSGLVKSADTSTVSVCNFNFLPDSIYDIKIWTSSPNGKADGDHTNDTLIKKIYTRIPAGAYTVRGDSPKYNKLLDAIADLIRRGICGSVTLNVRDGENGIDIRIPKIEGNTLSDTIVIQSEPGGGNVLYQTPTSYVGEIIRLDGVVHLSFKNITFERFYVNDDNQQIITTDLLCNTVNFYNTDFIGGYNFTSANENNAMVTLSARKSTIKDSHFYQGEYGIVSTVDTLYVTGNTFNAIDKQGLKINKSRVFEFNGNTLTNSDKSNDSKYSMEIINCSKMNFHNNYMGPALFENCNSKNGWNRIYNNVFYADYIPETIGGAWGAVAFYSCDSLELCNNTIIYDAQEETLNITETPALYAISSSSPIRQKWMNNIVINTNNHLNAYKAYLTNYLTTLEVNDYNDFYSLYGTNDPPTKHNLSINPIFTDASHHHQTPGLNNQGIPVSYIKDDVDGKPRGVLPDIGAHEYDIMLDVKNLELDTVSMNTFPNPVAKSMIIQSEYFLTATQVIIKLYDNKGMRVFEKVVDGGKMTIDVSELNEGIYLLLVSDKKKTAHRKIVITR